MCAARRPPPIRGYTLRHRQAVKKSRAVPLSLVSTLAVAAMASGCGSFGRREGWQTCIDRNTNVAVDRSYCDQDWDQPQSRSPYYVPHYSWYYYPRGYYWDAPGIGMHVPVGGSYSRAPYSSAPMARSGVSAVRGGFGSTAAGHASGS
jgi:hypothetical protein